MKKEKTAKVYGRTRKYKILHILGIIACLVMVILLLIQLGGLGFMTVITLVSFALGKKLGLYDRKVLMQSAGSITFSGIGPLIRHVVPFSFAFELTGAALLRRLAVLGDAV